MLIIFEILLCFHEMPFDMDLWISFAWFLVKVNIYSLACQQTKWCYAIEEFRKTHIRTKNLIKYLNEDIVSMIVWCTEPTHNLSHISIINLHYITHYWIDKAFKEMKFFNKMKIINNCVYCVNFLDCWDLTQL